MFLAAGNRASGLKETKRNMKRRAARWAEMGMFLFAAAGCVHGGALPGVQASSIQASPAQTAPPVTQPDQSQAPSSVASDSAKAHDDSFVIGNDDVLAINVWKEPELSRSIPVRSDGKITLPLIGEVQAAGLTPLQLERQLSDKLKSFVTTPEVTVIVEQIKSQNFNVLGMVVKPGSYSLATAATVVDAIAAVGGFKDFAKETKIYILRSKADGTQTRIDFNYKDFIKGKNLDKNKNVKLEPHDTIVVP
jgi:polysaccharide biosynthesis/export protein